MNKMDNPIATLVGGGSTIRVPDSLREVNTGAILAQGAVDVLSSSAVAAQEVNNYLVIEDAKESVSNFLTEEDKVVLKEAEDTTKRIKATSTSTLSGKASAQLRLDSAFKTLVAGNPHLANKLESIKKPAKDSRRYLLGKAVNEGEAAAYKKTIQEATEFSLIMGHSDKPLPEQLTLFAAKSRRDAINTAEIQELDRQAKLMTNGKGKQELITARVSKEFLIQADKIGDLFNIIGTKGRNEGLKIAEKSELLRQFLPALMETKSDEDFNKRVIAIHLSTLQQAGVAFRTTVGTTEGIVDVSQAEADTAPALKLIQDRISILKGDDILKQVQNGVTMKDINIMAKFAKTYPKMGYIVSLLRNEPALVRLLSGSTEGVGVSVDIAKHFGKIVNDLNKAEVADPPETENNEPPINQQSWTGSIKTLLNTIATGVVKTNTLPEAKKEGVSLMRNYSKKILEDSRGLADKDMLTSSYKSLFKTISTKENLEEFISTPEGIEQGARLSQKYFDETFKFSFERAMLDSLGVSDVSLLSVSPLPFGVATGSSFGDTVVETKSKSTGYAGITFNATSTGQLTFVVDDKAVANMTELEKTALNKVVNTVNQQVELTSSAIRLGAAALKVDPKMYATNVATHILSVKKPQPISTTSPDKTFITNVRMLKP
tara:strand:+ start:5342 stop:7318 length:1977 start_codon:yes stop_codon:yes gene_type:complete